MNMSRNWPLVIGSPSNLDCVAKTGRSRLTEQEFPITEYQPIYFVTESFEDAQRKMREFANTIPRSFAARYDPYTQRIEHLDSKRQVLKNMRQVRREMGILTDAMEKLS